jgi:phosphoglycolate phosphatase
VIFDFDGTLVDSAMDIMDAVNKLLPQFGHPHVSIEEVRKHIGEGFTPFMRSLAGDNANDPNFSDVIFQKFQEHYDTQLHKHTAFYDGVENFFKIYQNRPDSKIGIISNKPEYQVRIILKALGVDESHLVQIYGGDSFEVKKPHPKPLQEMMALAKVTPDQTLMIGDSEADVKAAQAAGTHFLGVSFGYNSVEHLQEFGATQFMHHFDELLGHISTLG